MPVTTAKAWHANRYRVGIPDIRARYEMVC